MTRIVLLAAATLALLASPCRAGNQAATSPPASPPVLRIETGRHTAIIKGIATDRAGRFLATASDDKTVRIWEIPAPAAEGDGLRLLRVIRPPIGEGNEGKLYAVALSPDGATVACSGWNANDDIYLFDRATGTLIRRISELGDVVNRLAFSDDGRRLAAAQGGKHGIRVFRSSDGKQIFSDGDFDGDCYGIAFDRTGRLAATCYDGTIRLYSAEFARIATITSKGGNQPYSINFSSDCSRIAVGYSDSNRVDILDGSDLHLLYNADTSDVEKDLNLGTVAWSADSSFLYAGGSYWKSVEGRKPNIIRRWDDGGHGRFRDLVAADNVIRDMVTLPDGRLAVGAGDPGIAILNPEGERSLFFGPDGGDFSGNREGFRITPDGRAVAFAYLSGGDNPATFAVMERKVTSGPPADALVPPRTEHPMLKISKWRNSTNPSVNGTTLQLKQYELSRSLAILPDGKAFVLGADWRLRLFSAEGTIRWQQEVPEVVWAVNVTPDARLVVAAYGDGTIRWHRLSDGKELLAFFPHKDGKRWVLWTPSGYYDASPGGEDLIGWHVNNGPDKTADFFPVSRFRDAYYRPDIIDRIFDTLDEKTAIQLANMAANRGVAQAVSPASLPPVVTIVSPADGSGISGENVTLRYTVRAPQEAPVTGVKVLIDGRPLAQSKSVRRTLPNGDQEITVAVPEKDCEVAVIAENRNAAGVPAAVRLRWQGGQPSAAPEKGNLYILAIGVEEYDNPQLKLAYAAKDAVDFARALERQQGVMYRKVTKKVLTNREATRDSIMDGLEWLQKVVTAADTGVIFLSGHGTTDAAGMYYYLPRNADADHLKRTGVTSVDIRVTAASLPGKVLIFLDTCHAGNVLPGQRSPVDITRLINELASPENGVVVFSSSTGKQFSLEHPEWQNGAFTKAVVEGLAGEAALRRKITVSSLDSYVTDRVKELTGGKQTPITIRPDKVPDFPFASVAAAP